MIKIGVIGTGEMGQNHVRIYSEMDDVELVGISDVNEVQVNQIAKKYNTVPFIEYTKLLDCRLDAVSIAVPTTLHTKVALDSIATGANVLVEKPIADTIENADKMITAASDAGLILMVGHVERFNPAITRMKEIIDEGVIGKILSISTRRVGPSNPRIQDVGIILDLGVHDIDIISYLYNANTLKVYTVAGSESHSQEDHASILLEFDGNRSGVVETNWFTPHKVRKMAVVGLGGVAYLDYIDQTLSIHDGKWIREAKIEKAEPLKRELEHFINSVRTRKTPIITGMDGKRTLKVALAAIESYKTGQIIIMD